MLVLCISFRALLWEIKPCNFFGCKKSSFLCVGMVIELNPFSSSFSPFASHNINSFYPNYKLKRGDELKRTMALSLYMERQSSTGVDIRVDEIGRG